MMYDLIICQSQTLAKQAVLILQRENICALVVRTPRELSTAGCSYSLKVSAGMGMLAADTLSRNRLPHGKVYHMRRDRG